MFYSHPKNQALFHNSALGLAAGLYKAMHPLWPVEGPSQTVATSKPVVPSFQDEFEGTPMHTKESTDAPVTDTSPPAPSPSDSSSLFTGLPEKIAQKGICDLFFLVANPLYNAVFNAQMTSYTGMGSALVLQSKDTLLAMQPNATSSFGFFEAAKEVPLQQSMPNAYQLAMICITVAVASMAVMSLYNSYYRNSDKQKCQSGCGCCGCTATATATATAETKGNAPVTATATATCGC